MARIAASARDATAPRRARLRVPWGPLGCGTVLLVLAIGAGLGAAEALGFWDPDRALAARCEDLERPAAAAACLRDLQPPDRLGPFDDEVGVVVVGLGLLIFAGALLCALGALQHRCHASDPPQRWLHVFAHVPEVAGGITRSVAGTVVNSPWLRAPLTGRHCVAWGLRLSRRDHEQDIDHWRTMWQRSQVQDLVIAYDWLWAHDARVKPRKRPDHVPQPGTFQIASDMIEVVSLDRGGVSREVALDSRALSQLADLGLPEDLRREIATDAHGYRLIEDCLTRGEFARCSQSGADTAFFMHAGSLDGVGAGCSDLAPILLFISLVVLIVGFALITGWQNGGVD